WFPPLDSQLFSILSGPLRAVHTISSQRKSTEKRRSVLSGAAKWNFTKCQQKQIVRESIFKCDRDSKREEKSQQFHTFAKHAYEIAVACLYTHQKQAPI
ncbi:hypothetical protein, partial [Acetobacter senegalensis]